MFERSFRDQVDLLITILGYMRWDRCFAMKGGTALNLFYADMPRLSVDIDLVYVPLKAREEALAEIQSTLTGYREKLLDVGLQAQWVRDTGDNSVEKLVVSRGRGAVKIEPNRVIRGCFYPPETKTLSSEACAYFQQEVDVACMALPELMAGKLVAMLDRQHPRDIFDMRYFLNSGHSLRDIADVFVAYLIQSNRPFSELLRPNLKAIEQVFKSHFEGMTREEVNIDDLIACRDGIIEQLPELLRENHMNLLLSIMEGNPDWDKLPFKNITTYPGVQWRLHNISKMSADKIKEEIRAIKGVFQL